MSMVYGKYLFVIYAIVIAIDKSLSDAAVWLLGVSNRDLVFNFFV